MEKGNVLAAGDVVGLAGTAESAGLVERATTATGPADAHTGLVGTNRLVSTNVEVCDNVGSDPVTYRWVGTRR